METNIGRIWLALLVLALAVLTARPDRRKTQPARRGAKTNFHHFRDTTIPGILG